jgi:hypothetical protein
MQDLMSEEEMQALGAKLDRALEEAAQACRLPPTKSL